MEYLCVDRFEGGLAVCEREDGGFTELPRDLLPKEVREGDIVACYPDGRLELDRAETDRRRQKVLELQNRLFE